MRWLSTASRQLPAHQQDLWRVVTDLSRHGEWLTGHDRWVGRPAAPMKRGQSVTEQATMFGATHTIKWTITECRPPSALRLAATGPEDLTFVFDLRIDPIDETSSMVTLQTSVDGGILAYVGTRVLESTTTIELDRALTRLEMLFQ